MSAYDNDPRVVVRTDRIVHVTERWHVLKDDLGNWGAHDAIDDTTCHGPVVGWVQASPNLDDVIRQLIGDPR